MRKFLCFFFLGAFAAATIVATLQGRRLGKTRSRIDANLWQVEGLKRELETAKAQNEEAARAARTREGECSDLQKALDALTSPAPVASEPPKNKPQSMQSWADQGFQLTGQNAEYQKLHLESLRLGYAPRYARLYKTLGLTTGQIQQLESLVLARQQALWDVLGAAQNQGLTYKDAGIPEMLNKAQSEATNKIKDLLGAKGYAEFNKASGSTEGGNVAQDIVSASLYTESPMTIEQADRLEALINKHRSKVSRAAGVAWDKVFAEVESILTPTQVALLKSQRESSRLSAEMKVIEEKAASMQ